MIDKNTHEIRQDEDKVVYKSLDEIAEDLPDHSPRYVLLSYPLTTVRVPPNTCAERVALLTCGIPVGRPSVGAVRAPVLPPHNVQRRDAHAVRRRQGVDEEYQRGREGD